MTAADGAFLVEENARLKDELRACRQTLNEVARECSCGICMEVFDQPCAYVEIDGLLGG